MQERKEEVTWERERDQLFVLVRASISILLGKYVTDFVKMLNSSQTLKIIGMKSALLHLVISVCWHLQHKQVLLARSPSICVSGHFSVTGGPQLGQPHCTRKSCCPSSPSWIIIERPNLNLVYDFPWIKASRIYDPHTLKGPYYTFGFLWRLVQSKMVSTEQML